MSNIEELLGDLVNLDDDNEQPPSRGREASSSVSPGRRQQPFSAPQVSQTQPTSLLERILLLPIEIVSLIWDHMISVESKILLFVHFHTNPGNRREIRLFVQPILSESLGEVLQTKHLLYTNLSKRAVFRYRVQVTFVEFFANHHSEIHKIIFHLSNYNPVELASAVQCQEYEYCQHAFDLRPSAYTSVTTIMAWLASRHPESAFNLAKNFITQHEAVEVDGLGIRLLGKNLGSGESLIRDDIEGLASDWLKCFDDVAPPTARLGNSEEERIFADAFSNATACLARERFQQRFLRSADTKVCYYVMSQGRLLKCQPKGEDRKNEIVRDDGTMIGHGYQAVWH